MFMHIMFTFEWRHQALDANAKSIFFDWSFHWKLGYNTSLWGFDGLTCVSGSNIMAKNGRLIREIPANPQGNSYKICFFLLFHKISDFSVGDSNFDFSKEQA